MERRRFIRDPGTYYENTQQRVVADPGCHSIVSPLRSAAVDVTHQVPNDFEPPARYRHARCL